MVRVKDPLLDIFRHRADAAYRENWMLEIEKERTSRKERKAAPKAKGKKTAGLIELEVPESITPGQKATVKLKHSFPPTSAKNPFK
jgi:N-sulfoglucosamine sulfohydrolase